MMCIAVYMTKVALSIYLSMERGYLFLIPDHDTAPQIPIEIGESCSSIGNGSVAPPDKLSGLAIRVAEWLQKQSKVVNQNYQELYDEYKTILSQERTIRGLTDLTPPKFGGGRNTGRRKSLRRKGGRRRAWAAARRRKFSTRPSIDSGKPQTGSQETPERDLLDPVNVEAETTPSSAADHPPAPLPTTTPENKAHKKESITNVSPLLQLPYPHIGYICEPQIQRPCTLHFNQYV